jgi:hypothetical protein
LLHNVHRAALRPRIIDTVGDGGHSGRLLQILRNNLVTDVWQQTAQKQRHEEAIWLAIIW